PRYDAQRDRAGEAIRDEPRIGEAAVEVAVPDDDVGRRDDPRHAVEPRPAPVAHPAGQLGEGPRRLVVGPRAPPPHRPIAGRARAAAAERRGGAGAPRPPPSARAAEAPRAPPGSRRRGRAAPAAARRPLRTPPAPPARRASAPASSPGPTRARAPPPTRRARR